MKTIINVTVEYITPSGSRKIEQVAVSNASTCPTSQAMANIKSRYGHGLRILRAY